MKASKFVKSTIAGLACLGMALPQNAFSAAPAVTPVTAKVQIADVALSNGTLQGKVVNSNGELLNGTMVKVSRGEELVGSVRTNANGEFALSNLESGLYQISTDKTQSNVRLWSGKVAPPSAKSKVLLVNGGTVRAQDNPFDYVVLGTAVVGVALGGAALADDGGDTIIVSP